MNIIEFEIDVNKKYQKIVIWNSMVYIRGLEKGHLLKLYYLHFWKSYLKKNST